MLWEYPIGLVHEYYAIAIQEERREKAYNAHVARIASYSARELSEKGSKQVEKIWSDLLKPLAQKQDSKSSTDEKLKTSNSAAKSIFGVGKMHTVTFAKQQEST